MTELTNLQPLPNTLAHVEPASPSSLLASDCAPSKEEHRGLALVLSTLMMRTNFWGPPEDCWRREKGRGVIQAVHTGLGAWHLPLGNPGWSLDLQAVPTEQSGGPDPVPG